MQSEIRNSRTELLMGTTMMREPGPEVAADGGDLVAEGPAEGGPPAVGDGGGEDPPAFPPTVGDFSAGS